MTLQPARIDVLQQTDRPEVRWLSPAAGLWVASRRGEHAGVVERRDGSYHARSARGRALGSFVELDSARTALVAAIAILP